MSVPLWKDHVEKDLSFEKLELMDIRLTGEKF